MSESRAAHNVAQMLDKTDFHPAHRQERPDRLFVDLRERNEYSRRVAERIKAQRERHLERVIQAQRRHRLPQAR
jgi:hypothetical protein